MTHVALIAPGSLLSRYCAHRPYQMALAGELQRMRTAAYNSFYKIRNTPIRWLTMDNGAWEDTSLTPMELNRLTHTYNVHEVVAPDILNDPWATFVKTCHYLLHSSCQTVAVVAHGQKIADAQAFIDRIAQLEDHRVRTIMIGRAYSREVQDPTARFTLASWIRQAYNGQFNIHLLGYNDDWGPSELKACQGLVRSIDTVAPFTAALANTDLATLARKWQGGIPRPPDYFDLQETDFDHGLVEANIEQLDEWAGSIEWRTNDN